MAYGSPSGNRKRSALKGLFKNPTPKKPGRAGVLTPAQERMGRGLQERRAEAWFNLQRKKGKISKREMRQFLRGLKKK
jgi:hypothetical protein